MTPEGKVKAKVVELLKAAGVYYFFPAANGYGRAGVPDIICCANGRFLAIECKAGRGTTTKLQDREIEQIRRSKGVVLVINETNIDTVELALKDLL